MRKDLILWKKRLTAVFMSDPDEAYSKGAAKYMRNQFVFIGLRAPLRKKLSRPFLNDSKTWAYADVETMVKALWAEAEREYQHFAMELLAHHKKRWNQKTIELIEYCVLTKSWWDTVDFLASNCAGPFFISYPELIKKIVLDRWNHSENMWLNRTAILYQLKYKDVIDLDVLSECILTHSKSKEFFHRKAIGWALRQHAKTDPEWVKNFVKHKELSGLSRREALKNLDTA